MDSARTERRLTFLLGCASGLLMLLFWLSSYDPAREMNQPWQRQITFELLMLVLFASMTSSELTLRRLLRNPRYGALVHPARLNILFFPWLLAGIGLVAGIIAKIYLYESALGRVLIAFDPAANVWGFWMSCLFMLSFGLSFKSAAAPPAGADPTA